MQFGYKWAFTFNAFSFLFSAACISRLRVARGGFRAERTALTEDKVVRPWHEYTEGLRYMRASPLILGLALVGIGWASGGGAAQILFSLFGELVFNRGPAGIGYLWAAAGVGLLVGGAFAHWLGKRISFDAYKRTISICYVIHGGVVRDLQPDARFPDWRCCFSRSRARPSLSARCSTCRNCCGTSPTNFAAACLRPWRRCSGRR